MSKAFFLDVSHCAGCYNCQLACKDEHCSNDWAPYSRAQPDTGQFWLKIDEHTRGTIPKVKIHYVPLLCNHCGNAACINVCEAGAIYRRDDGLVIIDPQACTGCGKCMDACGYGAIFFNDDMNIAQKCTGCAHLLDAGETSPRCVQACPTECIQFGEEDEFKEMAKEFSALKPELNMDPKVYYKGIPNRFIAGTVYDPVDKEVVIGAEVSLDETGGGTRVTLTDGFGDFWFKDLPEGKVYDLRISAAGFSDKTFSSLSSTNDVNLGDIPIDRKG
jgi:Fe-S-cluster-containing dehydrogenase component